MSLKNLGKIVPIMGWLPTYRREWIRLDVMAGLTAATVIIPKAMAYSAIAGLPLEVGLYTSLVMLVVYAVLGTSRLLSVTTSSTIAILASSALAAVAPDGDVPTLLAASATLSLLVGAFLLLGGLLRLGMLADLISAPVLTGFKAGIGLVIVLDQIPKLLGVQITKAGFLPDIVSICTQLPKISLPTLILALATCGLILALKHFTPRLPASLIAVVIGIGLSNLAGFDELGISLVGTVQAGLPGFALPDFHVLPRLWPAALGIALMSFVETAAAGRAFNHKGDLPPEANHELLATGLANLAGAFFHSMPGGGGTSQTAVNHDAGARSQVSGLATAAVIVATLLFLAPLFGRIPNATLAVVVIIASLGMINPAEFRAIYSIRTMEFHWALIATLGVMSMGTLHGLLIAVLVSMVSLIVRANNPPLHILGRKPGTKIFRPISTEHGEDETFPGLLLLRPEGAIYFANAPRLGQKIRKLIAEFTPWGLILHLSAVPDMEYTGLMMLADLEDQVREAGMELALVAMNPAVLEIVKRSSLWQRLGEERVFFTLDQAVERLRQPTQEKPPHL